MSKARNPDALIRIEDAIKVLCRKYCCPGPLCPDGYCVEMWDEFEDVERVDAVPVIRCKDCSNWCICHHSDNWFCTDGTPINTASDFYDDKGKRINNPQTYSDFYDDKGKRINNPQTYKSISGERKDDETDKR